MESRVVGSKARKINNTASHSKKWLAPMTLLFSAFVFTFINQISVYLSLVSFTACVKRDKHSMNKITFSEKIVVFICSYVLFYFSS